MSESDRIAAGSEMPPASPIRLTVSGVVQNTPTLGPEELRAFPATQITEMRLVAREDGNAGAISDVRGVRLRDVLEHAGIDRSDRNHLKKLVIVAASSDGYKAIFSWNELFNAEAGDTILVIFERDGKPLAVEEGPLALIAGRDFWTGPRHVKSLQLVEVRQIIE
ncbi:MAG: molybdopterin-dependent oxidoreductase [Pseudomonadota bacterium]